MNNSIKEHWERIYQSKEPSEVSWYQGKPEISLKLTTSAGIGPTHKIIDVGGGASLFVDNLIAKGFENVAVLDISSAALKGAKARLEERGQKVSWIEANVNEFTPPEKYDLWHDRAVFHFLTNAEDRKKYVETMYKALNPKGSVIIAAFAPEGPPKCSGLKVARYSPQSLSEEIGQNFELKEVIKEQHETPSGVEQKFIYCWFAKVS